MAVKHDSVFSTRSVRFPVSQLLIFYLPVAVAVLATGLWYVSFRTDVQLADIIKEERAQLDHIIGFIGAEVSSALHHLHSLAEEPVTKQALGSSNENRVQALQLSFLTLAQRNPFYQQVRWIDETGMERIRIMRDQGEPYAVAPRDLQNKSKRYYFTEANELPPGDLYISHLDLNVEHGQIEMPPRPMLRIATPVQDGQGRRRGIIVINIALKHMFGVAQNRAREDVDADYMVLNHEGYRLSGTPQGGRINSRLFHDISFAKSYPDVWREITETRSGNTESARGLWVWQTLSPAGSIRSMAQAFSPGQAIVPRLYSDGFLLTLLAHKPLASLITMRRETRMPIMVGTIIVLMVYGLSLYLYLRGLVIERHSEINLASAVAHATSMERLKELEERFRRLFEASSTGLVVVDDEGRIELSNPAAETIFGYNKGELEGLCVDDLLPYGKQEQHAALRKSFMQALEKRKMGEGRELKAVTKDGRKISVEVGLNPYLDRGRQLVLASVIDLSSTETAAKAIADQT